MRRDRGALDFAAISISLLRSLSYHVDDYGRGFLARSFLDHAYVADGSYQASPESRALAPYQLCLSGPLAAAFLSPWFLILSSGQGVTLVHAQPK